MKKKMGKKKNKWARRILSFIMALAMIVTMVPTLPGGRMVTEAAGTETNVTLHFMIPNDWGWTEPAIQYWGGDATVSGDANGGTGKEIPGWGGVVGYILTKGTVGDSSTDYSITLKGTFTGFQFLDFQNTSNTVNPAYDTKLSQYKEDSPKEVYYVQKDGAWSYYTDAAGSTPIPELPQTETTFLLVGEVPGMAWDPAATPNLVKSSADENQYSITVRNVPAGSYAYKILEDAAVQGWNKPWDLAGASAGNRTLTVNAPADVTISLNKTDAAKEVKVVTNYIEDLVVAVLTQAEKGQVTALPSTGTYYAGDTVGSKTEGVTVTYTAVSSGVTLNGTSLTVPASYVGTDVTIQASYHGFTKNITIPVVDKVYTYTIYYYDFDASHMKMDASDLWIWQESGAAGVAYPFTSTEVLADGKTWLKAEVELSYADAIRMIPRSKNAWTWQDSTKSYNNTAQKKKDTIYLVNGKTEVSNTLPELVKPRERYVMVEYDRPAGDYAGWNIFTWNSGYGSNVTVPVEELGGKMVAKIPVKDTEADLMLSFCMRKSETGNEWAEKDGGDHYVTIPANQTVVKAKFVQGEGITAVVPYNTGYEMDGANDKIHFYYRDDILSADYNMASLEGKVKVVINGTSHNMTYDAENDRFCYDLSGVETGDYYYYYEIDGAEVLDAFHEETGTYAGKECSVCHYKEFNMTVSAEMSSETMDYNDNSVLSVKYHPEAGESMEGFEVAEAEADLSALGLTSQFEIDPALMEAAISCMDTTTAGVKSIPVTVKDIYGNVYTTTAFVTVTERDKSNGDFDWDEAVIYFAVTDRFFDGNTSNNDAYGIGDYDTSEEGGSSYHGGDFSGLNKKLDYLQDLGVNTIWITPVVENITQDLSSDEGLSAYGYHGYWASDFTEINKHLGSKEEFKALLDAAHSRNMKIMVDVVLNHAGYETENYFNSLLKDEAGNPIDMIRDDSNTISGDDKYDSLSGLPDFVTENEEVRNQLVEWQTDWMDEFDIDYYRVDTVKHVDSTTWAAFKNSLTKVNPAFKMIGEYAGAGYANTAGELGTGTMDALLDFDFNDFAQSFVGGNISSIESSLQKRNSTLNNTATMGSFLGSHDEDGLQYKLVKESGFTQEEAKNLMKVAATLQITAKGQPVIYYGEELGQTGANNYPYQENRYDFDWAALETQKADRNSMYNHYKTMLGIRNDYTDVFARGSRKTVAASDEEGYEVISRSYGADTLYVGMNIKETAKNTVIQVSTNPGTVYTNLYDGKEYTVAADKTISITVPAAKDGGTFVLKEKTKDDSNLIITVPGENFSEVIDTAEKVEDGTTITVIMSETTVVPEEVFNAILNRDVTIRFQLNENVIWEVNGMGIKGKLTSPVDLGVTIGSSSIPADKIKALAGDNKTIEISLAHDGAFGFDAKLILNIGAENSGKYANLYYYNESTGNLEYSQACKVGEDGTVTFQLSHASEYVIVLSSSDMNPSLNTDTTSETSNKTKTAKAKTGDTTPIGLYVILLLIGGTAVVVVTRKRKRV